MFDTILIAVTAVVALGWLLLVAWGLHSKWQRRKCRLLLARARAAAAGGATSDARCLLSDAERRWDFNMDSGSRRSYLLDLDLYAEIVAELLPVLDAKDAERLGPGVEAVLGKLREFFADRSNFRIGGWSMKGDAPQRWIALHDELRSLRAELRHVVTDGLTETAGDFEQAAHHVLDKNADLYCRLR